MKKSLVLLFILIFSAASIVFLVIDVSTDSGQSELYSTDSSTDLYAGYGGIGSENDEQETATFRIPQGIVALPDGSVIVADTQNHLLRKIAEGEVTPFAGMDFLPLGDDGLPMGALFDEELDLAAFNEPVGLATNEEGYIYVADSKNHAIRKVDADNGEVITLAGSGLIGAQNGASEDASFHQPLDVVVSDDGTVYVADTLNHTIRKIDPDGEVSTLNTTRERPVDAGEVVFAGGWLDGPLEEALFNEPSGLVIDDDGNLYVSDTGNQLIRYIDLEEQTVSTVAGLISDEGLYPDNELYASGDFQDGLAEEAQFNFPRGLAMTSEGGLVIADSLNHAVRYLHDGHVATISGSPVGEMGNQNGDSTSSLLHMPTYITVMPDESILIADAYNNQIKIIKLDQ